MAIYFPSNSYVLDKLYSSLVSLDTDALSSWLTFLHQLHTATDLYTQDAKLGKMPTSMPLYMGVDTVSTLCTCMLLQSACQLWTGSAAMPDLH